MKICFIGDSHAAKHLSAAASGKGFQVSGDMDGADLVFMSQDTPTSCDGQRHLEVINLMVQRALTQNAPVILTSAVPVGFTRGLKAQVWHQAETLRIKDAAERAAKPEMLIIGCPPGMPMPSAYWTYLQAFKCPIYQMSWEEAEFAKIAINCTLAAQVENTNRLAQAAEAVGADWNVIRAVLETDKRIGRFAYLSPGRWQDSSHLMRDMRTLNEIERGD